MKLRNIILAALATVALFASCEKEPEVLPVDPNKTEKISVADFIAKADPQAVYTLSGVVENVAKGDRFWGFDLNDGTGVVTCAFPANWEEYKARIEDGGKITVKGTYQFYEQKGTHQVKKATILTYEAGTPLPPVEAEKISIKDFIAKGKAGDKGIYRLVGTVSETAKGDKFWGFDLNDGTATVTCAFPKNWNDFKDQITDGGTATVQGAYQFYEQKGTDQVNKAVIISFVAGEGGNVPTPETPEKPTTLTTATVAEFLAAPVNMTTWYKLTGKITKISGAEYGNFYIEDATGKVFVYGLTKEFAAKNDKSFASIGLAEGDEVTFGTLRAEHSGSAQAGGDQPAFYISHVKGEGGKPAKPDGDAKWAFTSAIAWTVSADAPKDPTPSYEHAVKVNGQTTEVPALKLGTSSKFGKATLTIPSGTKKLGFYAIAWKGKAAGLTFGNGTAVEIERGNDGATGSSPYTLAGITAIDYYEIALKGDEGTLTVETTKGMDQRAIIFGINPVE